MFQVSLRLVFILCSLILPASKAEITQVRDSLITFMSQLNRGTSPTNLTGWSTNSDPCYWQGVLCDSNATVRGIVLDQFNLTGTLDASSICAIQSLQILSLINNNIYGELSAQISNCSSLTHLYVHRNSFTGVLPSALSRLSALKRLDVSDNIFVGELPPGMSVMQDLITFLAGDNRLSGSIPDFNFTHLEQFNVSNNMLTGEIPAGASRFGASSFSGNRGLCGEPLTGSCTAAPAPATPSATATAPTPSPAFGLRPGSLSYSLLIFTSWILYMFFSSTT